MVDWSCSAWLASSSDVEAISSDALAFCCVTLSSCWIAVLIWSEPAFCSRLAAEISATSSAVRLMSGTSLPQHLAGRLRGLGGVGRQPRDFLAPRSGCARQACAPPKRRPRSLGRARPRARLPPRAFERQQDRSAARSPARSVISSAMVCIALTALPTASPLFSASTADWRAIFSVSEAFSAFCLMLAAISSIEDEASSVDEACSVAPWLSCSALADNSWLPPETLRTASLTSPTISSSLPTIGVERVDRGP